MAYTTRRGRIRLVALAIAAIAMLGALVATDAQAALRHFDGTVLSKNRDTHTFKVKTENGNRVRFHVNRQTVFQRIPGGFSGLHRGLRVEVTAQRTNHGLLAKRVEKHRRGGGGRAG